MERLRPDSLTDQGVPDSEDAPVPGWLKLSYIGVPLLGLIILYAFWDGSWGWFDRGAWQQLQEAANTTNVQIKY